MIKTRRKDETKQTRYRSKCTDLESEKGPEARELTVLPKFGVVLSSCGGTGGNVVFP